MASIGFYAKKGGVGKTTMALLFFRFMRNSDITVGIKDMDPQGTLGAALKALGWQTDRDPDYTLVDYPSKLSVSSSNELKTLDRIIVPTGISFADQHALKQSLSELSSAGVDKKVIRIVPNRIRHGSTHAVGIDQIKKLKFKMTPPMPLRMEIEDFVDRKGKLHPSVRETVNQIIIKAVG